MSLHEKQNKAVQELGDAINSAIENSPVVADALEHLRRLGYEADLNVKLEIRLQEVEEPIGDTPEAVELELTEEDRRTLRRMKIRVDD
ncbi:MAG: hypothetical protein IPM63_16635 [Acidobacteriota bacterium]|nr:MAG: hypothetical protein IPM63_16635 [Acidobacteriota bacterium]